MVVYPVVMGSGARGGPEWVTVVRVRVRILLEQTSGFMTKFTKMTKFTVLLERVKKVSLCEPRVGIRCVRFMTVYDIL